MIGKIDSNPLSNGFAQDLMAKKPEGPVANLSEMVAKTTGAKPLTEADYRLVIEKSARTGSYVYKTLNSFTGEVVSQRPAEDVVKMGSSSQYAPGGVVNAKA